MSESMEHEIRTLRAHFWSDRDPDGRAFAPLAEAYLNRGDVEEALALVQDGLGRLPDYATGHLVAARVHRVRGDQAAARVAVEALLALDRGNAPGLRLLGEISEEAGEVEAAIDAFREALERDPGYADLEGRIARLGYPATGEKAKDLPQGSPDAGEEQLRMESSEPVHGDLDELDSGFRSGPESELDSGLDFESDGESALPPPPSEDLIFDSFDDPFEETSGADVPPQEPALPLATRTMAELYIRQGFTDRGVAVYRQLVERDPENAELRGRLEELESATGGGTLESDESADGDKQASPPSDGDEQAGPPSGGAEDDPWGSAPQWTGEDPGTAATDRSPFAWVSDPGDSEGDEGVDRQGRSGSVAQAAERQRGPSAGRYLQDLLAWEPGAVSIESLAPEGNQEGEEGGERQGEPLSDRSGADHDEGPFHSGSREA